MIDVQDEYQISITDPQYFAKRLYRAKHHAVGFLDTEEEHRRQARFLAIAFRAINGLDKKEEVDG